jgi:hypothetical protein
MLTRASGLLLLALLASGSSAPGQEATPQPTEEPGIQDNSFLIEEAYNQDPGVVQHINAFVHSLESSSWQYTFTQEWPVTGLKHQLSYSVPLQSLPGATGIGDLALNYRYQLVGDGEAKVACAPRLSVLLPTGSVKKALGVGGPSLQLSLPISLVLSKHFVAHWNGGLTHVFSGQAASGERSDASAYNLGASLIWLASARFDVLVETVWSRVEAVVGPDATERADVALVSPGIRWAYNFRNGLQIVPGLAFPLGVGPSRGNKSLLVYLSFEHPFKKGGASSSKTESSTSPSKPLE